MNYLRHLGGYSAHYDYASGIKELNEDPVLVPPAEFDNPIPPTIPVEEICIPRRRYHGDSVGSRVQSETGDQVAGAEGIQEIPEFQANFNRGITSAPSSPLTGRRRPKIIVDSQSSEVGMVSTSKFVDLGGEIGDGRELRLEAGGGKPFVTHFPGHQQSPDMDRVVEFPILGHRNASRQITLDVGSSLNKALSTSKETLNKALSSSKEHLNKMVSDPRPSSKSGNTSLLYTTSVSKIEGGSIADPTTNVHEISDIVDRLHLTGELRPEFRSSRSSTGSSDIRESAVGLNNQVALSEGGRPDQESFSQIDKSRSFQARRKSSMSSPDLQSLGRLAEDYNKRAQLESLSDAGTSARQLMDRNTSSGGLFRSMFSRSSRLLDPTRKSNLTNRDVTMFSPDGM